MPYTYRKHIHFDKEQFEWLKKVGQETHVPIAVLVRQGLDLLKEKMRRQMAHSKRGSEDDEDLA